jgi:hypothetical protein
MKTIAGIMAEMLFVVRTTTDVSNAQTITTVRQSGLIAIGTWNVKNAS